MLCQIHGILESAAPGVGSLGLSDPTPDQTSIGHPPKPQQSSPATGTESAKKQLMTPVGKATPKVKGELPPTTTTSSRSRFVPQ